MVQLGNTVTGPDPNADPNESSGHRLQVAVWVLAMLSAVFVLLRFYVKIFRRKGLWWDDWILLVAWCILFCEVIVNHVNITQNGFGHHIWTIPEQNWERMGMLGSIASSLTIISETWSKTSFAVTLLRITEGWTKRLVWFCIVSVNILMTISIVLQWTQCVPVRAMWNINITGKCISLNAVIGQGIAFSAYSGIVDMTLAMLPWKIIWGLKMRMKEKIGVGVAMSMGVFAGIAAFVKCAYIPTLKGKDFPYNGADLVIWGNVESAITIIAASIPVLRALFAEVRNATTKAAMSRAPRAPSCVIRQSNTPLTSNAALAIPDKSRDLEAGSSKLSRRSIDSLADLERPVERSSFELRQQKIDADRTLVAEAAMVDRQRKQERLDSHWPWAIV